MKDIKRPLYIYIYIHIYRDGSETGLLGFSILTISSTILVIRIVVVFVVVFLFFVVFFTEQS